MSKISKAITQLSALRELLARVREEIPQVAPLLDALERDDYQRAWETFSGYGDVAAVFNRLPDNVLPYLDIAGPYFMEALDAIVDEAALRRFLDRCGLLSPGAR